MLIVYHPSPKIWKCLPYLFEPEASPEPIVGDSHTEIKADREEETSSHIHNTNW